MRLRRLTEKGLEAFSAFLDSLNSDAPQEYPQRILTAPATSTPVTGEAEVEVRSFANRMHAARYLDSSLSAASVPDMEHDQGLWAWLALFYFEVLCPVGRSNRRKPGERARWIPAVTNFRKYYRHLLAGPYRIFRAHRTNPDAALALLCTPVDKPGDIAEQLASRQELVTNRALVEVATRLYVDTRTNQPRRGAAGRGPGSARRLADVVNQLDLTWDLYALTPGELMAILPPEFDRFRRSEETGPLQ